MGESQFERQVKQFVIDEAKHAIEQTQIAETAGEHPSPYMAEGVSVAVDVDGDQTAVAPEAVYFNGGQPESVKPTNVKFNTTDLLDAVATSALSAGAAVELPVIAPAAVLAVLISVKRATSISLSKRDAVVFYAIHTSAPDRFLSRSKLQTATTAVCRYHDIEMPLSEPQLEESVDTLAQIGAIEVDSSSDTDQYRAMEQCSVSL
ncbi:hypothetical protein [Halorubrum trueperi]|uniref:Uncharacterized protein n=1 Tax=Halorubrum trueperi TaxID=2004704 RepID=A0ABD5UIV6_9EURY